MSLKNHSLNQTEEKVEVDRLEGLNETQLLELRNKIDAKLVIDIGDMNLTEELGLQYRMAKAILAGVQDDAMTPANQKAQLMNTMSAVLAKIIEHREFVFSAERLKRYEAAVLKVLDTIKNEDAKAAFLDLYGEFLDDRGV